MAGTQVLASLSSCVLGTGLSFHCLFSLLTHPQDGLLQLEAKLSFLPPFNQGERTTPPIRRLPPLPFRSPEKGVVGGSLEAPLRGQHVRGEVAAVALPTRELEKGGNLPACFCIPSTSHSSPLCRGWGSNCTPGSGVGDPRFLEGTVGNRM